MDNVSDTELTQREFSIRVNKPRLDQINDWGWLNNKTDRDNLLNKSIGDTSTGYNISWNQDSKYKVPYRIWAGLEYDLRKDLKFLALAWIDNGYKTMDFRTTWRDYTGDDDSAVFSIDSPWGSPSLIDFDFGVQYAVSETFRFGIHFQQPYLDFYWEFFEF